MPTHADATNFAVSFEPRRAIRKGLLVELRHLRDFVAVADELSFTRAAKKLHVAQPSLTQQIKLLEQELGVRLLNRVKGRVSLTEAGKLFLADSRRVIALSEDSVRAVQHFNQSETRQLKIGYVASLHYHLLPATLATFQRAYPEVALNLFDMTCAQQLEALEADKIDLGFIGLRESLAGTNLQAEAVAFYEILVALPKAHPLSKKPKINLKELESHFFVGMSERNYPGWGEWMRRIVSEAGFTPRTLQEADGPLAVLAFVAAGLGAALLPEQVKLIAHPGVAFRPLKPVVKVESCIAWRSDNTSKPLDRYVEMLKQSAK
jgi:DNA-binding transcriptional LysR family regulator